MYLFYCIGQSAAIAAVSVVTAAVIAVITAAAVSCNLLMINCYCNKSCKLDAVYFFHEARS